MAQGPDEPPPLRLATPAETCRNPTVFMGAKPNYIELGDYTRIPILYEDRSVIAIDKPPGWMLVPFSWQKTNWNLQAAITSSIAARDFWARSRNLRQLRHVHRLDAETTGVLLFAKSTGALDTYSNLFEARKIEKVYLAIVLGIPKQSNWVCRLPLAPSADEIGKVRVDKKNGKPAETRFQVLDTQRAESGNTTSLIEARPITGRTHQIRVHLAESGSPVIGDPLYASRTVGPGQKRNPKPSFALRSIVLAYIDPFTRKRVRVEAPWREFLISYGFDAFCDRKTAL